MALKSQPLDSLPAAGPDRMAAAVFQEQVSLLYRLSRPAYGGTVAVALTIAAGLWVAGVSVVALAIWFGVVAAVTALRVVIYRQYIALAPAQVRCTGDK